MPFNLLTSLARSDRPVAIAEAEDIDKLRVLHDAGLVEARIPGVSDRRLLPTYAGQAVFLSVTDRGRTLTAKARAARQIGRFGA